MEVMHSFILSRNASVTFMAGKTVMQGRAEIGWHLGQESSLAPPCLSLRSFWSKCTVFTKVLVILLGHFGTPPSDFAPAALHLLAMPLL